MRYFIHVEEGEAVALIGRNAAGKTTIMTTLMGIAKPFRGRVRVLGADAAREKPYG